jgi:hypothetical protein
VPGGPWTWVVYEVGNAAHALDLRRRGVRMVESMTPLSLRDELAAAPGVPA